MNHFSSVLVANRGEIARRIIRSARAAGLHCIAVYAGADEHAPFVVEADDAVRLPGGYLDPGAILEAARATGAEAVHPGYGFLSENGAFAAAVIDAGLVWVGPPPEVVTTMGDKLAAKRAATAAGVPILPSSEDPADASAVGYPLLVKASAGGGGKGMRIVESEADLEGAVLAASREARTSFGDPTVFLERYVGRSRHIEIQILGDAFGNLVHLGERECSIQRRHQKILEEAPSTALDEEVRSAMGESALRLAKAIGYQSAGTVEFLLDEDSGEFFFLEVNTRLQVEHPVTEMVTGIDLVREQLRVAAGERLDVDQGSISFSGHAVEVRLYAEDPASGFLPASGRLAAFVPAADPEVRWDSGVEQGSVVGLDFDPMLAKVIAHAPTRTEAAARLALALTRTHLGGVTTNRDFLVATLRSDAFLAGDTTTDFIERVAPAATLELDDDDLERALAAAALWLQGRNRAEAPVLAGLPSGWRNGRLPAQEVTFERDGETYSIRYQAGRDGTFTVWRDGGGGARKATVHRWSPGAVDVEVGGRRFVHTVTFSDDDLFVQVPTGTVSLAVVPRFAAPSSAQRAGAIVAPMPGGVIEVKVEVGDQVTAGQDLLVLEAMKMEHHMRASGGGVVVEVCVRVGDQVGMGDLLLVVEADDDLTEDRAPR